MLFSHPVICLVIRCQRILRWPFAIFIAYPVVDIFKNLRKRHVFWFLVVFHPCYLLSRSPYTLPVCLVYRIFRNIYSLSIHFCSLCFVLFGFVLLHRYISNFIHFGGFSFSEYQSIILGYFLLLQFLYHL